MFALPADLVTPLGDRYRTVLLMPELGPVFTDREKVPVGFPVAEEAHPFPGKGMRMAAQFALGHHHPLALDRNPVHRGGDPLDRAQQHITLSVLPWHRGSLLNLCRRKRADS